MKWHWYDLSCLVMPKDHMTATLPCKDKAICFKNLNNLTSSKRFHALYAYATFTSVMMGRSLYCGMTLCSASSSSIQRPSTSEAFSCASSNVDPKVTQPGKSGNDTS